MRPSTKGGWHFEMPDHSRGGVLTWHVGVRVRHVGSGKYLSVRYPPRAMHRDDFSREGRAPPHYAPADDADGAWFEAIMVDEPGPGTLFTLEVRE